MKGNLAWLGLAAFFLFHFVSSEIVSCGNQECDSHNTELGCCDDYGIDNDQDKHCVPISVCELKGNKWAWLVTLISFLFLAAFIILLCVAKTRLYKDRMNYFDEEDEKFDKLDQQALPGNDENIVRSPQNKESMLSRESYS